MFDGGVFWGLLIIVLGLLLVIKQLFNLDMPVTKITFGFFFLLLGIKILFFNNWNFLNVSTSHDVIFGSNTMIYNEEEDEYNVVFGEGKLDLTELTQSPEDKIEVNAVFGEMKVYISKNTKLIIKQDAAFGSVKVEPDKHKDVPKTITVKLKANAVFGSLRVVRE